MALSPVSLNFETRLGIPRPDWKLFLSQINSLSEEQQGEQFDQAIEQWFAVMVSALPTFQSYESGGFLIFTDVEEAELRHLPKFLENSCELLYNQLGELISQEAGGKFPLLIFSDIDTFCNYIADTQEDDVETSLPSGVCYSQECVHIALHHTDIAGTQRTLFHELVHAYLCHLSLPLWLNEGVTQLLESAMFAGNQFHLDDVLVQSHRAFWNAETIQQFWSGDGFYKPGDSTRLSYSLAEIIVRIISEKSRYLIDFVRDADYIDAGETSALQHLGVSLGEAAAIFLGDGDWAPARQN